MEFSNEAYAAIGALLVTNIGAFLKIFLDWKKSNREEIEAEKKEAAKTAVMQNQMNTLLLNMGELKAELKDLKNDFNALFSKFRSLSIDK